MGYYKNDDGDLIKVAGSSLYADNPIGTILAFGGSEIPVGWHLCDGTAVSRTAYAELFAIIGTNFGVGDGSTTFNLPDLQGEFLRGAGTNSHSGQGDGANVGVHQDGTVTPHSFGGIVDNTKYLIGTVSQDSEVSNMDASTYPSGVRVFLEGGALATDNYGCTYTSRPTNTSVNYIIKMKPVAFPSDVLTQIGDALSYSTAEKLTGGRWIDGKPIYQITIVSAYSYNTGQTLLVPTTVFSTADKVVVDICGVFYHAYGDTPHGATGCYFNQGSDGIVYSYSRFNSGDFGNAVATIRYTKKTD